MGNKKYTIEELIEWFLRYRRWSTADPIDNIGQCDFENEFFSLLLYIKNCNLNEKTDKKIANQNK